MKGLPLIDTQWEPMQLRAGKLAWKAKQLERMTHENDEDAVNRFMTGIQNDLHRLQWELGYMSGWYGACAQREQEDAEGVLDP